MVGLLKLGFSNCSQNSADTRLKKDAGVAIDSEVAAAAKSSLKREGEAQMRRMEKHVSRIAGRPAGPVFELRDAVKLDTKNLTAVPRAAPLRTTVS